MCVHAHMHVYVQMHVWGNIPESMSDVFFNCSLPFLWERKLSWSVVTHACVSRLTWFQSEFQDSQRYWEKPCNSINRINLNKPKINLKHTRRRRCLWSQNISLNVGFSSCTLLADQQAIGILLFCQNWHYRPSPLHTPFHVWVGRSLNSDLMIL